MFEVILNEQTPEVNELVILNEQSIIKLSQFFNYASGLFNAAGLAANQTSLDGKRFNYRAFMMRSSFLSIIFFWSLL